MRPGDNDLSETDIRPPGASSLVVRSDSGDPRPWLAGAPVCPALAHHLIHHLGIGHMPAPFRIVRTRLAGSYFLACFRLEATLGRPWTVARMAAEAHLSERQLERLCRKELGRNPRQQLIWLRMRRAAELLTASDAKVETVAAKVGYRNPFVFSTTFRRV